MPIIDGVIERRVLVNFRVAPQHLAPMLPAPLRLQLVDGWAIGGICLIRLTSIRPKGLPAVVGLRSENAAHRIAVEWDDNGRQRTGVFVPRRDTDSPLNTLLGGRLFPGVHHRADFAVREQGGELAITMRTRDGGGSISVTGRVTHMLPESSVFGSVDRVSTFFEQGSVGYSPARDGSLDAIELETFRWEMVPLAVDEVFSSYFHDTNRFPEGSAVFDSAMLMRDISHRWHQRESLCASVEAAR